MKADYRLIITSSFVPGLFSHRYRQMLSFHLRRICLPVLKSKDGASCFERMAVCRLGI